MSLLDDFLPDNPLMAQAWVDCLRWATHDPSIVREFIAQPGAVLHGSCTPLARMIDAATGADEGVVRQFVAWFDKQVWGAEL